MIPGLAGSGPAIIESMRAPLAMLAASALSLSVLSLTPASAEEQPALGESGTQSAPAMPSDRVIVRWEPGVDRTERAEVRDEAGADQAAGLGRRFQLLTLADGVDPDEAVAALRSSPDVAGAQRDGYSVLHANQPNDPLFNQLWGLDNQGLNVDGVSSSTPGADISALAAWDKTVGDPSVIVADLDDGIRPQHPDLQNRIWQNTDETPGNGIDDDGNGYIDDTFGMDFAGANIDSIVFDKDPTDSITAGGHGTHTAGTIAAEGNNGVGITGVAQQARIMPIRVCGWSVSEQGVYCPFSSQIAGINYAGANGAKIANMSLGGTSGSTLIRDAFAANPQTLFVISAGNDGKNVELSGQTTYPCSYDPRDSGSAVDNVICVAASDQNDLKASFSNWGKVKVDIAAPGTETLSTYTWVRHWLERFETTGWPYAGWAAGGWVRSNTAPLTNWGIGNDTATQANLTTRTTITPAVSVTGPRTCRLNMGRIVSLSMSDVANYKVFVDASQVGSINPTSSGFRWYEFSVPSGTHNITARFSYTRDGGSTSNGFWLSELGLSCWIPPGSEGATTFGFLQGTSMAAPHVSGAAALLKAHRPAATTTQIRQALLTSVDPVAQFNPNTGAYPISTGGRLNVDKALTVLEGLTAPPPPATPTTPTPQVTAPAKVTGLKVKRKKKKAVVRWQAVSGATGYEVRLGKRTMTVSGTKATLKKLKPKKKYKVKVVAVNSAGGSPAATVKVKKFKPKRK